MPDLAPLIEFGKTFGFPALVTGFLLWMLWRGTKAVYRDFVRPFFQMLLALGKRLLVHFDNVEGVFKRVDDRTERIEHAQSTLCRAASPSVPGPSLTGKPATA